MKILCVFGEHNYGDPARGAGYEYVNFLPALRNLGHQIVFFESYNRNKYRDFGDLNRKFLEQVQAEKPDIILCVLMHYELWLETFRLVREGTSAVLINWSTDDSWKYEQFSRFVAPAFHIYATTYSDALAKSAQDGQTNFVLTQWAANSSNLAEPMPASQCLYPVSFIGSRYGNRAQWVTALAKQGVRVECFGHGWKNGAVAAEAIPQIMRNSMVSLNFADSGMLLRGIMPGRSRQIKARTFEVPGAGGFLMTEYADGLEKFYRIGEEIVVCKSTGELAHKIRYFIQHPEARDRIAKAGYIRTRDEHTYEKRFGRLLDLAMQQKGKSAAEHFAIDFEEYDKIEQRHATGLMLKLLRTLLLIPCVMLWGKTRGPRAARRLLFELSWKLAGKKTYSASGWPGRIFYKES